MQPVLQCFLTTPPPGTQPLRVVEPSVPLRDVSGQSCGLCVLGGVEESNFQPDKPAGPQVSQPGKMKRSAALAKENGQAACLPPPLTTRLSPPAQLNSLAKQAALSQRQRRPHICHVASWVGQVLHSLKDKSHPRQSSEWETAENQHRACAQ